MTYKMTISSFPPHNRPPRPGRAPRTTYVRYDLPVHTPERTLRCYIYGYMLRATGTYFYLPTYAAICRYIFPNEPYDTYSICASTGTLRAALREAPGLPGE